MKTRPVFAVIFVACSGLVGLVFVMWHIFQPSPATTPQPAALVAVSTATLEPTATPQPTPDFAPTKAAQEIELANAQAALATVNLQIASTNLQIENAKAQAQQAEAAGKRADADKAAQDAIAADARRKTAELTLELKKQENERLRLLAQIGEQENQKQTLIVENKKADSQWWYTLVFAFVGGGVVVSLIYAGRKVERYRLAILEQTPSTETEATETPPKKTRIWKEKDSILTDITPPGDIDAFRAFAEYALRGNLLGINSAVDKNKAYHDRPFYARAILPWMSKCGYVGHDLKTGGAVLSDSGVNVFQRWLLENPTTHPLAEVPQNMPPAGHNHENNDHESDGGPSEGEGEPKIDNPKWEPYAG